MTLSYTLAAMADNRGPADSSLLERSDHSEDMISNSGTALDPREIEPLKDAVSQSAFPLLRNSALFCSVRRGGAAALPRYLPPPVAPPLV